MKRVSTVLVALAVVGVVATPGFAAVETITGTVVDQNYMKDKPNTSMSTIRCRPT